MELEISAVFKIVDENNEAVADTRITLAYSVDTENKPSHTKEELYNNLKSRVATLGDNYTVQDMTKEELEQFKLEEKGEQE